MSTRKLIIVLVILTVSAFGVLVACVAALSDPGGGPGGSVVESPVPTVQDDAQGPSERLRELSVQVRGVDR